jgi:hypothetical protein
LIAIALGGAVTQIASGALTGFGSGVRQGGSTVNPAQLYVDKLFRTDNPSAGTSGAQASNSQQSNDAVQAEVLRLWTADFSANNDLGAADKGYVARLVSARTGISEADAEKRVNDVITEAKTAADRARRSSAQFSFWLTASLLLGAFAAALAAVEGGQLRDGTWTDRTLTRGLYKGDIHGSRNPFVAPGRANPDHHLVGVLAVGLRRGAIPARNARRVLRSGVSQTLFCCKISKLNVGKEGGAIEFGRGRGDAPCNAWNVRSPGHGRLLPGRTSSDAIIFVRARQRKGSRRRTLAPQDYSACF